MLKRSGTGACYTSYNPLFADGVVNSFSLKEIISDDFLENLYPIIKKYSRFSVIYYFSNLTCTSTFKPTEEESKYLFNRYFNIICSKIKTDDIRYNLQTIIKTLERISNNVKSENEIIQFLFNENFFKNINVSKDVISEYINKIISSGKIENIESFISLVREQVPEYSSFPLVILNPNISKENKIKAIKLTYKQKDFPQYKKILREKVSDFDDIDIFIKATIFENNRVKEKEENLIKFFKDIFICGEWRFQLNDMKNTELFFKEYKSYFTNNKFISKLYKTAVSSMQTMQYERRNQYEHFIKLLFSSVDDLELIKYVAEVQELKSLGTNFVDNFLKCFEKEKYDICEEYLKVFAKWSETQPNFLYSNFKSNQYSEIIDKFADSESIHAYLSNLKLITDKKDNNYSGYTLYRPSGYYYNQDAKFIISDTLSCCLKHPQLLKYFNAIKSGQEQYLGLEYSDIYEKLKVAGYSSRGELYSMMTCTKDFYDYLLITVKDKTCSTEYAEALYKKYLEIFENEDNTQELSNNIMSFNSNEKTKYYEAYRSNNSNIPLIVNVFLSLIDTLGEIAKIVYPLLNKTSEYEIFKSNINYCKDTLNIVCSM